MRSRDWRFVLLVAVGVESILALMLRVHDVRRLLAGDQSPMVVLGIVALAWIPVLVIAATGVGRSLRAAHRLTARGNTALADVATTSHDWVWAADRQLRLTYTNSRVTDLLGFRPDEVFGVPLTGLLAPEHVTAAQDLLATSLRDRVGWQDVELDWVHRDGHLVRLQDSAVPIQDSAGVPIGFRGTRRLVTSAIAGERALLATRLRIKEVLDTSSLEIALQPIVGLAEGRLVGAEALARFHDGRSPDRWFDEARESGQSLALDLLAFRTALLTLPALPAGSYLSVNATPELITNAEWQNLLLNGEFPLERLVVEITEHAVIPQYEEIRHALTPLRERGVRLAVDDTGAGYASLSHVLQLRPDIIKVDRSLVAKVTSDAARRSLITALVLLALDLGATVTAEGIETPSELETIATLGVDDGQGYLLARPTTDPDRWRRWQTRNWIHPAAASDLVPSTSGGARRAAAL